MSPKGRARATRTVSCRDTATRCSDIVDSNEMAAGKAPSGVDVDSVMRQLGVLGRYHRRVYPLVALAAMQVGLLHTTYIFLAGDVNYRYNIIYAPLTTGITTVY